MQPRSLKATVQKSLSLRLKIGSGGRLHTLDDLPGRPEAGAIQIGQGYRRMEAIATQLGGAGTRCRRITRHCFPNQWCNPAGARLTGIARNPIVGCRAPQRTRCAGGVLLASNAGAGETRRLADGYMASGGARVRFVGEHLARDASGIEGALESDELAAAKILSRL